MIVSFGDKAIEDLYHGRATARVRRFPRMWLGRLLRKLDIINAARDLQDLQSPPGNRLEALKGNLKSFHSIRANEQWRVVFRWQGGDAHDVRLTDYH